MNANLLETEKWHKSEVAASGAVNLSNKEALMKEQTVFSNPNTPLETLIADAFREMERRGYGYHTVYEASRYWRHLAQFAKERGIEEFSAELVADFLKHRGAHSGENHRPCMPLRNALRVLTDLHAHGCWEHFALKMSSPIPCSPNLTKNAEEFLDYWNQHRKLSNSTRKYGRRYLNQFLIFLEGKSVRSWEQLTEAFFSDFFASKIHMAPGSLELIACVVKLFMEYLFSQGITERNWAPHIPRFRRFRNRKLPSIWTTDQLDALLSSVDRVSPVGKRDYAILLLSCRLGIRASDIRHLRLDDLKWDDARIEFVQKKTGAKVTLPLMKDVGEAIIDYLRSGRPVSHHREIFLKCSPPHEPFSEENKFYGIVTQYRRRAGIQLPKENTKGLHSLRHTVATRLQAAHVPLETISDIMGHASLETTRLYARVDIAALKKVALEVGEVQHGQQQ